MTTRTYTGGLQTEPNFLLDVDAINRKYAEHKENPNRQWTGVFTAPRGCSDQQFERIAYDACKRWIDAMQKRQWALIGKLHVSNTPYLARDIDTQVGLLDRYEYRVW